MYCSIVLVLGQTSVEASVTREIGWNWYQLELVRFLPSQAKRSERGRLATPKVVRRPACVRSWAPLPESVLRAVTVDELMGHSPVVPWPGAARQNATCVHSVWWGSYHGGCCTTSDQRRSVSCWTATQNGFILGQERKTAIPQCRRPVAGLPGAWPRRFLSSFHTAAVR
jgi:hypothetical protein